MAKILLVDDIPEFVAEEQALLRESAAGYQVKVAAHPEYALQCLAKEPFDLVILDLMMPHKNGFELLREIKKQYGIPVIIYSAYLDFVTAKVLMREGADMVLSKPAPLDVFLCCVRDLLLFKTVGGAIQPAGQLGRPNLPGLIQRTLNRFPGRFDEAAAAIGIPREYLLSLMERFGLTASSEEFPRKKIA